MCENLKVIFILINPIAEEAKFLKESSWSGCEDSSPRFGCDRAMERPCTPLLLLA